MNNAPCQHCIHYPNINTHRQRHAKHKRTNSKINAEKTSSSQRPFCFICTSPFYWRVCVCARLHRHLWHRLRDVWPATPYANHHNIYLWAEHVWCVSTWIPLNASRQSNGAFQAFVMLVTGRAGLLTRTIKCHVTCVCVCGAGVVYLKCVVAVDAQHLRCEAVRFILLTRAGGTR